MTSKIKGSERTWQISLKDRHDFDMPNTSWKNGRKFSLPVRDRHGNNINFRLECQLDKGNKRFVLRWQDPTDLDPETGKKNQRQNLSRVTKKLFKELKILSLEKTKEIAGLSRD